MKFKKSRNLLLFVILIIFSMQLIGLGFLFFCPVKTASAQVTPGGPTFTPQVDIPGSKFVKGSKQPINGLLIAEYIQAWYKFAVAAVGILAVVMIMAGGLIWLTAGGQADKISTAKDWIAGAVVGLILALMSYTLLYILNPNLVTFESLDIKEIEFVASGLCCFPSNGPQSSVSNKGKGCTFKDAKGAEETGTRCNVLQACKLNKTETGYECVDAKEGDSCGDETACPEGWFCTERKCWNGSATDPCDMEKTSCASGFYCSRKRGGYLIGYGQTFDDPLCYDGANGDTCDPNTAGQCNKPMCCINGVCGYDSSKGCCVQPNMGPCQGNSSCCGGGDCEGWWEGEWGGSKCVIH